MTPTEPAPLSRRLTQAAIRRYAEATGDFNPIHVDEAFARSTEFGGTIAHGMLVLAALSEMMTAAFSRTWLESGKLDVRFRAPARPGDTITARVKGPPHADAGVLRYSVEVVKQDGEVLISGNASLRSQGE